MCKRSLFVLVFSALVMLVYGQDNMFPSANPPANLKPAGLPQYVCVMWDDNSYSGLKGTLYESGPVHPNDSMNRVGGYQYHPWHTNRNVLNLQEGDMGVSWVVRHLLPSGKNPDGSKRTMSFHVISGQMASVTWKTGWVASPVAGDIWGWKKQTYQAVSPTDTSKTMLAPVCWGREYATFTTNGTSQEELGHTVMMYKEILDSGFEIGSHTIDHLETNSPLPKAFWPVTNLDGYDPGKGKEVDLDGTKYTEEYGSWDTIGWDYKAGNKIAKATWKGAFQLAEAELTDSLKISIANGKLFGFRAPRLETNSNMLLALKESGYTYDCSMEEINPNTTGAIWPYTTDNGSPSAWYALESGDFFNTVTKKPVYDQYPAGLWEIPVTTVIVPDSLRDSVWAHAKAIATHSPEGDTLEPFASWKLHGRITGFDFNMFILWGMTRAQFVTTMKYNLDMALNGNRAPFVFGAHPDQLTPIYDNAVLLNDYNKTSYGLVITNGYSTWKTRQQALLDFFTYAASKTCNFVGGMDLVKKMRALQAQDAPGTEYAFSDAAWTFFKTGASTSTIQNGTGAIAGAAVTVDLNELSCGFAIAKTAGYFKGLDHIALTYNSTAPLKLVLTMGVDKPWEVLLNNTGAAVNSGKVPLSAFHYDPNAKGTLAAINTQDITGIKVEIAIPDQTVTQNVTLSLNTLKLYGAAVGVVSPVSGRVSRDISFMGFTRGHLKFAVGSAGRYSVNFLSANGRSVASYNNMDLCAGLNSLKVNSLAKGVYVINIAGNNLKKTMKTIVQ